MVDRVLPPVGRLTAQRAGCNTIADVRKTVFAVTGGAGTYAGARGTVTTGIEKKGRVPITVQI